ncbi:hypothetical protein QC764_301460 [Podospora pseudoanserina]|uniref:Uncharacterized protein n=1 Tax=Podospora pseudoanserina TaxID=2609844 RepID=A0ABR0IBX2_9PEZI|nr:hypothetical protein QC764_301460 [Podospora pseudoanserina]
MPRQLPWKINRDGQTSVETRQSPNPTSTRSPAPSNRPSRPSTAAPNPRSSHERFDAPRPSAGRRGRSPSTSPPPEPPSEELMIEGVDHDDRYRMVEDEFLAVAGEFTRHLHAAEYQRLKGLARSQNADTISNISRPVTGEMTEMVKRRHAALNIASKQRKGITQLKGLSPQTTSDTDDEGAPSRKQPNPNSLQGLMDSPRKQAVPLTSVSSLLQGSSLRETSPSSGRMAPPGLRRAESTFSVPIKREPTPDSDDLDSQAPWPIRRASTQPSIKREMTAAQETSFADFPAPQPRARSRAATIEPSRAMSRPPEQSQRQATQDTKKEEDDDDDNDFLSRIRARRLEQRRRRESRAQPGIKSETQEAALDDIAFV